MQSFNLMESHTTGKPSQTPSGEPSSTTGQPQINVLQECLDSGRRFREEYEAGDPLIFGALEHFRKVLQKTHQEVS
jgi:hypothetical protein